ncbi:glutamine--fructose-6-phosphate transaminase (isomerizing) [soil metagenome]
MCGIVGAVAQRNVVPILLEGLKRLEYRGYDSAGIALISADSQLQLRRMRGKVHELVQSLDAEPLFGNTGIAHTRWATHGAPSEQNAHPHTSGSTIALVHNGIIENHELHHRRLLELGYKFTSQTDTEIVVHLLHHYYAQGDDLLVALQRVIKELKGAYSFGIISKNEPHRLLAARFGSPLVIGLGIDENFIASDILALLPVTQRFIYLEEGDIADVGLDGVTIYDVAGNVVQRTIHTIESNVDSVDRGEYRHYMQKEIFEQPEAVAATLEGRISKDRVLEQAFGLQAAELFPRVEKVQIVACGTSYHAGKVASYWLEELAGISCSVEVASEYRYRHSVVLPNTLFVVISQSGETADTLAALRLAKSQDYLSTLAICNTPESSLVREANLIFMTRAGMEIGVASTKAFTTQLVALLLLTIVLGRHRHGNAELEATLVASLHALPEKMRLALLLDKDINTLVERFADKHHALFLGRGAQYPVALEGALKLKEISYIHAEAYPAGELKHGPLALVDDDMPVVVVAPNDELLEKLKSNLQEVRARGGELIVFADASTELRNGPGIYVIEVPTVDKVIAPLIYTIPLQLLAYQVAVTKGTDVDQPRNLAKSVTVE